MFDIYNITLIFLQYNLVDINIDLMTQAHHTLKSLKISALKNLESIYKESFTHYDNDVFKFFCKDAEISNEDEDLSLGLIISKVIKKLEIIFLKKYFVQKN